MNHEQANTTDVVSLNVTVNPSGMASESFGSAVRTSNGTVVAGAQSVDTGAGRAYMYDADRETGRLKLVCDFAPAPGAMPGDRFGASVAVDENWVIVGSPNADRALVVDVGEANLFRVGDFVCCCCIWLIVAREGDAICPHLSQCITLYLLISKHVPKINASSGCVDHVAVLSAPNENATAASKFGFAVAVAGDYAIVGAIGGETLGISTGRASVYLLNTGAGTATLLADIASPELTIDARFGTLENLVCLLAIVFFFFLSYFVDDHLSLP